jgi:hypothetical protein
MSESKARGESLGKEFLITSDQLYDDFLTDARKRRDFIFAQRVFRSKKKNFPFEYSVDSDWNSLDDMESDISKNGLKRSIEVESIITDNGKKYRVIWGAPMVAIALEKGIVEFMASEIVRPPVPLL